MKGKIIICLPSGVKVTIRGVRDTDYEEMIRGKEIITDDQNRVIINQNNIAVIVFEPEK